MSKLYFASAAVTSIASVALLAWADTRKERPPAAKSHAKQAIHAAGRIEGVTPEIALQTTRHGRVAEIYVRPGQLVTDGQPLLRLDSAQQRHEVTLAEAQLDQARAELSKLLAGARKEARAEAAANHQARLAQLNRAQRAWQRFEKLRETQAISQQEADDRYAELRSLAAQTDAAAAHWQLLEAPPRDDEVGIAQAQVRCAEARLALARDELAQWTLVAPRPGQILKLNVEPGELTGPNSPKPAVILSDTSHLFVRAFVEEADAPRIAADMSAHVTTDGLPGHTFTGQVIRLSPLMTSKHLYTNHPDERIDTKVREVWIKLNKAEGLVVGLRVDVSIGPPGETLTQPGSAN